MWNHNPVPARTGCVTWNVINMYTILTDTVTCGRSWNWRNILAPSIDMKYNYARKQPSKTVICGHLCLDFMSWLPVISKRHHVLGCGHRNGNRSHSAYKTLRLYYVQFYSKRCRREEQCVPDAERERLEIPNASIILRHNSNTLKCKLKSNVNIDFLPENGIL